MRLNLIYPVPAKSPHIRSFSTLKSSRKFSPIKISKIQKLSEFLNLYLRFISPHILALTCSLLLMLLQNTINSICFLSPSCICDGSFLIKLYSSLKFLLFYWNLVLMMIFYLIFTIKELNRFILKLLYFILSYAVVITFYMSRNGDDSTENDSILNSYFGGMAMISFIFLAVYKRFRCRLIFPKIYTQISLLFISYIDFVFTSYVFYELKEILHDYFGEEGKGMYQIFLSFYYQILLTFFKVILLKYGKFVMKSNFPQNGIYVYFRIFLIKIFALNTSTALMTDLNRWNGYVLLFCHVLFLFRLFFQKDLLVYLYNKSRNFIRSVYKVKQRMKMNFSSLEGEIFTENNLPGYVIDFQHIYIIRIIILWGMNQWYGVNIIEYYEDCSLKKSEKFSLNQGMLLTFIGINLLISLGFMVGVMTKKFNMFKFSMKEHLSICNAFYILLFYGAFEVQLQEYHAIYLNKMNG